MATFKNISDRDLSIPGHGIVKAGERAELPEDFHNGNFERVELKGRREPLPGNDKE